MVAVASRTGSRQFQRYSDGRRIVVGCIPYRYKSGGKKGAAEGKVEVLVITSQKGQGILFPKGGLEIGESVREGACRETREEAGVLGKIQGFLGHWTYKSKTQDTYHEGLMYSLLVTKQFDLWQEKDSRQRIWMDIETAREECRVWWMREALETLIERLAKPNQENLRTTLPISEIEIKDALFSIQDCKAPGPDGCSSSFFKKHWDLIKADLVDVVQEFFTNWKLLEQLNVTAVARASKGLSPSSINDFHPISCCNVICKVISKVVANRVKKILGKLISESQGAFVQGRNIKHNILLCQELAKHYSRARISPKCCLKVDLRKAFDSLHWGFIAYFLPAFNFPPAMAHWILQCITTTKFSIILNCELHGFLEGKQGLRQGDRLSLYIFVLVMECFSRMMHTLKDDFQFNNHPKCRRNITHLCFADDVMLFSRGDLTSIQLIKEKIDLFTKISGMNVNSNNSHIFLSGVDQSTRAQITSTLDFEEGSLPIKYLGDPLSSRRLLVAEYQEIIDKMAKKIHLWAAQTLSLAGRKELVRAIVLNIQNFWCQIFQFLRSVISMIQSIIRNFLWSGYTVSNKHLVAWKEVAPPHAEGRIGFKELLAWNRICYARNIYELHVNNESIWSIWVQDHYLKSCSIWNVSPKANDSWICHGILQIRDHL